MTTRSNNVYSNAIDATAPAAAIEAEVLIQSAARMMTAITSGTQPDIAEAVQRNYRLWLVFYSDIEMNPDRLAKEIQVNILELCNYVFSTATLAMSGDVKVITSLADINRNLAGGLLQSLEHDKPKE